MSSLVFWTALSGLLIALMWAPYIVDRILVRGLMGAMANPGPDAKPQSPWAERQKRAHGVAVESFVAFGPLAALAELTLADDPYPGVLAATYFLALLAHYTVYTLGVPVARTLAFAVAALATVAMALRVLGWI